MSTDFDFTKFDADTIDTSDNYDPIPEGTYECVVEKTEMLPTKKGDGSYLKLTFSVIDGQYDGRKFFTNFNLVALGVIGLVCAVVYVQLNPKYAAVAAAPAAAPSGGGSDDDLDDELD